MPDNPAAGEPLDGQGSWDTEEPDLYHFLDTHDPPRPGCFLLGLKCDLRSWRALRFWGIALVATAIGIVTASVGIHRGSPWPVILGLPVAFYGARLLFVMVRLFRGMVRNLRHGPLLRGVVHSLMQPFAHTGSSAAEAQLPDGRSVLVAVNTAWASALLRPGVSAEVIILADPDETQGSVICMRPMTRRKAEAFRPKK
jgi:hypothetical protein